LPGKTNIPFILLNFKISMISLAVSFNKSIQIKLTLTLSYPAAIINASLIDLYESSNEAYLPHIAILMFCLSLFSIFLTKLFQLFKLAF